jgi:hypothetical protein
MLLLRSLTPKITTINYEQNIFFKSSYDTQTDILVLKCSPNSHSSRFNICWSINLNRWIGL